MGSPLGEFLRARREATTVDQVGLRRADDNSRTPGLRRDEVAMLAGVSTDYYMRLEQGRERHPSDQVIDSLARALLLGSEATEHLHRLARARASQRQPVDHPVPELLRLVENWDCGPAFIVNRRWDVLVRNPLSMAVCGWMEHSDNLLRLIFLNPESQEFFWKDWEREAHAYVAHLRVLAGGDDEDPFLRELVDELTRSSEAFRRVWARHDVYARTQQFVHMHHREFGDLAIHFEGFNVNSAPGQILVVGQAEPGSRSEDTLITLGRSLVGST
ncbi:helix-turn-helix transcriptional regulator [Planotetraspora kaengkrachanensis]|uniref:Transcriptional regulator n=1 Tax=Planotetraspora kaengkrachanensis TaxID=575193 RepID=A0A8J3Q0Y1_9ACTN|nr:helix-turn-helix transcriptional regulator [Planotetraspora kaengkrachanensis]GIG84532.1 transcriptional regulator [Planotetraspora kaengkrachanensis]